MTTSERTSVTVEGGVSSDGPESAPVTEQAPPAWRRVAIGAVFGVAVLALSVITVFRYTTPYLQSDGVGQSLFSVQDVDLFFWGQDRFAAVVSFLASPIADPMLNLFLCLLINAVAFHVLLLVLSWMGVCVVVGRRTWQATLVLFLVMIAVAHLLVTDKTMYAMTLESQPFPMSWGLALGAFMLWKRRQWWFFVLATAMVGVAVGLNQSTVLIVAFLAVFEFFRRGQWVRWPIFGVVWVIWLGTWVKFADWFGGNPGPNSGPAPDYFGFHSDLFVAGFSPTITSIVEAIRPIRLVVVIIAACLACLLLRHRLRPGLLSRLAMTVLFCTLFWTVFTGNSWVSANGFTVRYFFPVVVGVIVVLTVPLAAALLRIPIPHRPGTRAAMTAAIALVACIGALFGPLTWPSQSRQLLATKPTADYIKANDITFLAGYFWSVWPIELQALENGRTATYVTAFKSGGNPANYRAALDRELAESDGPPRAICVDEELSVCITYLEYWTRPGWHEVAGECPIPVSNPLNGSPPVQACRLLEFTPQ